MTVAAVIIFARGPDGALADAAGRAVARRTVEAAWAGGATPIVVVSADPDGTVAQTLAGSPAVLAEPAPAELGPAGQIVRGIDVAARQIRDTDAVLIWPGRLAWVDAETVTTLIEAHGTQPAAVLRPRYGDSSELGWPALIPVDLLPLLRSRPATALPDELLMGLTDAGVELRPIDTGDPGTVYDIATPIDQLPEYRGPPRPVSGNATEWGSSAADLHDDVPLEGPALAPYAQAADETRD